MRRGLVWACGGVALVAAAVAFWPAAAPDGAAALPAAPAPAPSSGSAAAPSGRGEFGTDSAAAVGASPAAAVLPALGTVSERGGFGRHDHVVPARAAEDLKKREEEHLRAREAHRGQARERADQHKQQIALRHEQQRAERAAYEAARPPDPNRPAPERQRLQLLGPAIVADPQGERPAR